MKVSWIHALLNRAKGICSNNSLFKKQVQKVRKFMSWNGFPRYIRNKLVHRFTTTKKTQQEDDEESPTIWLRFPYAGEHCEHLVQSSYVISRDVLSHQSNLRFYTKRQRWQHIV